MNKNMIMNAEVRNENIRCAYDTYLRLGMPTDALIAATKPLGSYLLHEEFETKLVNAVSSASVLRPLCTEVKTTGDTVLPIVNSHGKAEWIPEGGTLPLIKDQYDRALLDSHELAAIIRVTSELLKESAIDIEQYLSDSFADRLASTEEEAFVAGDGVDKPKGLIYQAKVGCETQTADMVAIEDILNLIFSVQAKYRRNGVLLMNDKTLLQLYRQCASQGVNLWFGKTNDGKDDTFFGYRVVCCAAMPDVESGNVPVLFGDFKQVYINDCGKRSIRRLKELFSANDHVGFLIDEHVGIKLIVPDAIRGLKVA